MPLIYFVLGALAGAAMAAKRPRETEQVLHLLKVAELDRVLVTAAAGALTPQVRPVLKTLY
jgi:hypothetical protein